MSGYRQIFCASMLGCVAQKKPAWPANERAKQATYLLLKLAKSVKPAKTLTPTKPARPAKCASCRKQQCELC